MGKEALPEPGSTVLISACLVGVKCNYRGHACPPDFDMGILTSSCSLVPVCPEQLGGMSTPRVPSEIVGGTGEEVLDGSARVMSREGGDVTTNFLRGAEACARIAKVTGASWAVLQSRSPSCGCVEIHAGKFDGTLVSGMGVAAARLLRAGVGLLDASLVKSPVCSPSTELHEG